MTEVTKRPKSAGTRFKESMIALVANLQTKDPFYVRCIKPNEIKSPMRFDDERCLHQVSLKYGIWGMRYGDLDFQLLPQILE